MFSQIKRLPLLAALMLYAVTASAGERYTLDNLLMVAIEKNPSVAIFRANVEAQKGVVVSSRAYPNPELGIEAGRGRSLDGPDSGGEYSVSIGQPIERPARRHFREKAAEAGVLSSEKEKEGYLLLLRSDVKKGFYRLLHDKRIVKLAGENAGVMDGLLKAAEARVKAGEAPEFELVKARVEKLRVDKELKRAEKRVIVSKAALNALLGNTLPEDFDIEGDFSVPEKRFDLQSLLKNAVEKHPSILKARREAEAKGYTIRMEEASVFPGVTLKGFAGRETGREWYGVGLSLPIPVWYRKTGEIAAASAEKMKAEAEASRVQAELTNTIIEEYQNYNIAIDQIEVFEKGLLKQAEEALRIAEASYRHGESGLMDYLDAQRVHKQTLLEYNQAFYELEVAAASLERAAGTIFTAEFGGY